jgi:hypothetical protein
MKKLLVLALVCLAAAIRVNGANGISIGNVFIQNGGKALVTLKYECETANSVKTCGFTLKVPEGITVTGDYVLDNSNKDFSNVFFDDESNTFSILAGKESVALNGTSGTLAYITLEAASTATGELTVNVTNAAFTINDATVDLPDGSFKVTVEDRVIYDENSTTQPVGTGRGTKDIRVNRTIKANTWSTVCFPFDMSAEQLATVFGEVKLGDFNGIQYLPEDETLPISEIIVNFKSATSIAMNHPYIIKVSNPINTFTLDAVKVTPSLLPVVVDNEQFIGTYVAGTTIPEDDLFLSDGKFYYSAGSNVSKGFRCYFHFQYPLDNKSAARIGLNIDGETTYIDNLGREINDGIYYDLQGRRVNNPGKGVYIQSGKKVFVK